MSDDKVDLFWPALVATISPVPGAHRQILALLHDMAFATIIYEGSSAGSGFIDAVSAPTGPETWKQTFPSLRALLAAHPNKTDLIDTRKKGGLSWIAAPDASSLEKHYQNLVAWSAARDKAFERMTSKAEERQYSVMEARLAALRNVVDDPKLTYFAIEEILSRVSNESFWEKRSRLVEALPVL